MNTKGVTHAQNAHLLRVYLAQPRRHHLAVRSVGSLGDNTVSDEISVAPVLALSALAINRGVGISDSSPESAARDIFLPSEALSIEEGLATLKGIVVHSLQRPFANEDGELAVLSDVDSLAANGGRGVLGVGAGGSEVVDVGVEDDVGAGVVEGCPVRGAHEVVLDHHGDAAVDLGDLLEHAVHVRVDPVGGVDSKAGSGAKAGEVVGGLVDRGNGESVHMAGRFDEAEDAIDCLVRISEVGRVVKPVLVHESLPNVKAVDTTRKRVQANDDVHVVFGYSIVGDGLQVSLLVTAIELRPRNLDPGGVGRRDAKSVDTNRSELIDSTGVQERGVASLKDRSALGAKHLAESPLVRGIGAAHRLPPERVVSPLLCKPAAKVGTVGLEGLPVDELASIDSARPDDVVNEARKAGHNFFDVEGALSLELDIRAMTVAIRLEGDTEGLEDGVQVIVDLA